MAKGSAMGLWRGKKGSSVFYKIKNSNSAQKQGIRERVYEVSNPQTAAQASQRMKMLPAQRVYGAIKDVIERSWQGVTYGEQARYEFLKKALKADVFPAVDKNSNLVVPGPYDISKGTLQQILCDFTNGAAGGDVITNLQCDNITSQSTYADFSKKLIELNPFLQNGDQLSFVICCSNADGDAGVFIWGVRSFILDVDNTDLTFGAFNETFLGGLQFAIAGGFLKVSSGNPIIYAAAVILSREGATPLRSSAFLRVAFGDLEEYYSTAAMAAARASYMKSSTSRSTDWPADPNMGSLAGSIDDMYIVEGLTGNYAQFNGTPVRVRVDEEDGSLRAYYYKMVYSGEARALVGENGRVVEGSVEMDVLFLTPDRVPALAELPGVLFTEGA